MKTFMVVMTFPFLMFMGLMVMAMGAEYEKTKNLNAFWRGCLYTVGLIGLSMMVHAFMRS